MEFTYIRRKNIKIFFMGKCISLLVVFSTLFFKLFSGDGVTDQNSNMVKYSQFTFARNCKCYKQFICNILCSRPYLPLNRCRQFSSHIYSGQNDKSFNSIVIFFPHEFKKIPK